MTEQDLVVADPLSVDLVSDICSDLPDGWSIHLQFTNSKLTATMTGPNDETPWMRGKCPESTAKMLVALVNRAREIKGLPEVVWPE